MRLLFFGTPEFAVPSLQQLLDRGEEVVAVICQPDRPAGRGQKPTPPPVKQLALVYGLNVLQPEKLRAAEALASLRAHPADLAVVAAYGKILAADVLQLPRLGCINVHASLLPRHRGAAPIQWAILRGDAETGVTIMQMDEGMDTGPMLLQRKMAIGAGETYGELQQRLALLGAAALSAALDQIQRGAAKPTPQDGAAATMAPKIEKERGQIDWAQPAVEIERRVRAFNPWPSTFTHRSSVLLKIHRSSVANPPAAEATPGMVVALKPDLVVACGSGALRLDEVQLEGKQRTPGAAFARGARLAVGDRLG